METAYLPRVIDSQIGRLLGAIGGILLEGPRACGKTATGEHHANSAVRLDVDDDARHLAEIDPSLLLEGPTPRLIDEWQLVPQIWNHARRRIDDLQQTGAFILAGSATPADDITRHSGAGRIARLRMRPMSLFESGHSTGEASLRSLIEGSNARGRSALSLVETTERICIGGWPALVVHSPENARDILVSYLDDLTRIDIPALEGETRRDPARVRRTIQSLARNTATEASVASIARDTGDGVSPMKPDTVAEYLRALERVMVVEDQPSWGPHLRSRDVVRQSPKRHFVDPSLAAAAIGATPARLRRDPNTLGLLFESLVIRDLRIYTQSLGGEVSHYRDSAGREVDAILTFPDGSWAAVEVKLGTSRVDAAVESLARFVEKVDTSRVGEPAARVVVTGGEYAYTRADGVSIVPLGTLAP